MTAVFPANHLATVQTNYTTTDEHFMNPNNKTQNNKVPTTTQRQWLTNYIILQKIKVAIHQEDKLHIFEDSKPNLTLLQSICACIDVKSRFYRALGRSVS